MRPQKVLDKEILEGLTQEFRSKGYEGASLKDLADATGLKKASLYHRFPNGKQEMANAVLNHLGNWVDENVFQALKDENNNPHIRLKNALSQVRALYDRGNKSCILRALSMQSGLELFQNQVQNSMKEWVEAFKTIGLAFNQSKENADKNALRALIEIQGGLVVAKGLNDISVFEDTLGYIEHRYLNS